MEDFGRIRILNAFGMRIRFSKGVHGYNLIAMASDCRWYVGRRASMLQVLQVRILSFVDGYKRSSRAKDIGIISRVNGEVRIGRHAHTAAQRGRGCLRIYVAHPGGPEVKARGQS